MKEGMVQVYTWNRKGKTTGTVGIALRAAEHGVNTLQKTFLDKDQLTRRDSEPAREGFALAGPPCH
jgi:ATP:corrinoid adenosyltransferase